jgi:3-hydroxyisobutyrate dehydrogenase-like beta-hydroxyacid dehydrogenase
MGCGGARAVAPAARFGGRLENGRMPVVAMMHPGQMGAALAAQARRTGAQVLWCPAGRSAATAERAEAAGLTALPELGDVLAAAEIVLSVCPPEFAEDIAMRVAGHGYEGIFVEANAISPRRSQRIAERFAAAGSVVGAAMVDGAIIGPPPRDGATARVYLAGEDRSVGAIEAIFLDTDVEVVALGDEIGAASALKMAFAGFNKISHVLSAISHALAARHQVTEQLIAEAERLTHAPLARPNSLPGTAARAWRWAPEMDEIADTLGAAGLPPDMARAAASVLARWEADKDDWELSVEEVLARLGGA